MEQERDSYFELKCGRRKGHAKTGNTSENHGQEERNNEHENKHKRIVEQGASGKGGEPDVTVRTEAGKWRCGYELSTCSAILLFCYSAILLFCYLAL